MQRKIVYKHPETYITALYTKLSVKKLTCRGQILALEGVKNVLGECIGEGGEDRLEDQKSRL